MAALALPRFARAALAMPRSGIREIMEMSSTIPNCIHLEVGQPDLPSPAAAIAEAQRVVPNFTQYISSFGLPRLRESVARYFERRTGVPTTSANIIITQVCCGGAGVVMYGNHTTPHHH